MAAAQINGTEIAYQQMGEGPDLVFVHGLAASRAFWFLQYAMPLSRHFRITLFDLRGHGYSGRPDSGYDAATLAEDLRALLDLLAIERCSLIGHSYGGGVAMEFAGRHPDRVERLALLDTKLNSLQPEMRMSDSPHVSPFEAEIANKTGRDWDAETQVGLRFLEDLARWKLAGGGSQARDAFTPFGEGRGATRTAKQLVDVLDNTSARSDFVKPGVNAAAIGALKMPVLLIYGEYSRCLPTLRQLQQLLPQARTEMLAQGGHFFPQTHGRATLALIESFLGLPSRRGDEGKAPDAPDVLRSQVD